MKSKTKDDKGYLKPTELVFTVIAGTSLVLMLWLQFGHSYDIPDTFAPDNQVILERIESIKGIVGTGIALLMMIFSLASILLSRFRDSQERLKKAYDEIHQLLLIQNRFFLTVEEVTAVLGLPREDVGRLIESGEIDLVESSGLSFVTRASMEEVQKKLGPRAGI